MWTYGDMGRMHTSHPPFAELLCRTGKGIEEPALGPPKGSSGQGQPAETQSSDVIIGKCSNQGTGGSELYATHPRSLSPSQQQSWVPDAAMGSRLLCCVTLCLLGAGVSSPSASRTQGTRADSLPRGVRTSLELQDVFRGALHGKWRVRGSGGW